MTEAALPDASRNRRVAFYFLVGLLAFFTFTATFVIFSPRPSSSITFGLWPILVWFHPQTLDIHQIHNLNEGFTVWIFLITILLQLLRPKDNVAALQLAIILILGGAIVDIPTGPWQIQLLDVLPFFTLLVFIALLHPRRHEMLQFGRPGTKELLALVALATMPLLIYIVNQLNLQLTSGDEHAQYLHYSGMVIMAISILSAGLLAAFKTPGWRIPAWAAGLDAAFLGLTSVTIPDRASSFGIHWGSLAVLWGLVFIGTAEWKRRQGPEA